MPTCRHVCRPPAPRPSPCRPRRRRQRGGPPTPRSAAAPPCGDTTSVEPWSYDFRGRLDEHVVSSEALKGNPLGDPTDRPLWVYVPPGYDEDQERRYPSVYAIQGMTGQLDMWRNRFPFRRNFPELVDELYSGDDTPPPALVVYVDCWTSLGGSQFLDSP